MIYEGLIAVAVIVCAYLLERILDQLKKLNASVDFTKDDGDE